MRRQLHQSIDAQATSARDRRSPQRRSFGCHVPQEHNSTPDEALPPRDWSHLGRRVLAEAWRRLTDERVSRSPATASPVVRARDGQEERA